MDTFTEDQREEILGTSEALIGIKALALAAGTTGEHVLRAVDRALDGDLPDTDPGDLLAVTYRSLLVAYIAAQAFVCFGNLTGDSGRCMSVVCSDLASALVTTRRSLDERRPAVAARS